MARIPQHASLRRIILVCALLLPAVPTHAALLAPEEAVAQALQKNAFLEASSARVAVAEGLKQQAGLKPNPRLFLQSENARFGGHAGFNYAQDTDNFLYASQVFEMGGKRRQRVELAEQNIKASGLSLGAQKAQVAVRVLTAYWTAAGARQLERSLAESLATLERSVEYHRIRVREGSLPEADLIRIQVEYQQVSISFQNARQDSKRLLLQLFREMGVPAQTDVDLAEDLAAVPNISGIDIDESIERRPDVKLAAQSIQQAQSSTRLQRANAVPDPEVLFGYKRTGGYDTTIAGVQINLPFRNRNQGNIAAAAAEETAAAAALRATRLAARTEITALLGEYEQKREVVNQLLPSLRRQSDETSRIAQAVYREGASDLLRLVDAERARLQTEALYIRTITDYRLAATALQAALGLLQ